MKYTVVPYLCDDPKARDGFIESKMSGDVGYLDRLGHLHTVDRVTAEAIKEMFQERDTLDILISNMRRELTPLRPKVEESLSLNRFICYAERMKKIFA